MVNIILGGVLHVLILTMAFSDSHVSSDLGELNSREKMEMTGCLGPSRDLLVN